MKTHLDPLALRQIDNCTGVLEHCEAPSQDQLQFRRTKKQPRSLIIGRLYGVLPRVSGRPSIVPIAWTVRCLVDFYFVPLPSHPRSTNLHALSLVCAKVSLI